MKGRKREAQFQSEEMYLHGLQNGYQLDTVRIIFSRDVVFNEQEYCGGSQFPEEDTSHRVMK